MDNNILNSNGIQRIHSMKYIFNKSDLIIGTVVLLFAGVSIGAFLAVFVIKNYPAPPLYERPVRQSEVSSYEPIVLTNTTHREATSDSEKLQHAMGYRKIQVDEVKVQ